MKSRAYWPKNTELVYTIDGSTFKRLMGKEQILKPESQRMNLSEGGGSQGIL